MKFDAISKDPVYDKDYPPFTKNFTFQVDGDNLLSIMYVAQGKGPHPTILLLHGFPGNEKNFDLAQIMRRAGYNVMVFHYRGCWGSEGTYSVKHVLEDTNAAIDILKSDMCVKSCRVDPNNIVLMGYSLGGFAAMITLAKRTDINAMAFIVGYNFGRYAKGLYGNETKIKEAEEFWADSFAPLRGITKEQFIKELIDNRDDWDLVDYAEKLKDKKILMIAGTMDEVADIPNHHRPIADALKKNGGNQVTEIIMETDHDCSNKRVELAENLLTWLNSL